MPIEIRSTKDVRVNGVKMVVYGPAGSGKTKLMSTAPNPIIISAEQGLLSLADYDLPYIKVTTLDEVAEAYKFLRKNDDYDTICLDSLSEIAEVLLEKLKMGAKDKRQAYGEIAEKLGAMIRKFRDIEGKNVVFTAKQRTREDESTGLISIMPSLPGKVLPESLPYFTDLVLYIKIKPNKEAPIRKLQTYADHQVIAKDRSGKLDKFEDLDLTNIFNKAKGK